METEELIARIERAFAGAPYPGDDALIPEHGYGEERDALRRTFAGKTDWRALDASFLNGAGGALAFFSDRAFHFYLPAYLIADLRGELTYEEPATRLCSFVTPQSEGVRIAEVWGGGTLGERARSTFDLFDREQRACIVEYLWWKLRADDVDALTIEQALEHYWLERG